MKSPVKPKLLFFTSFERCFSKAQKLSKGVIIFFLLFFSLSSLSQQTYDVNYQMINFGGPGVTIVYKVGNGKNVGNVVLYQNVITINGQPIDAIVRTTSLSPGTTVDYFDRTGTGSGYSNNQDVWFSPQFTFAQGGGQALFNFEFILGGSYNNSTNTGTNVTLQNVQINTYDIDGNGNTGTNQFNEFGGFFTSELASRTVVSTTYNSTSGLTKFRSTISNNVTNAADPTTRVRVTYSELSSFPILVGAEGGGQAFFFLDFGVGPAWNTTITTTIAPIIDLNTTTSGKNNSASFCSSPVSFTAGGINITSSTQTPSKGTTLERIKVSIPANQVLDAANEQLLVNGATSGGNIPLYFSDGAAIPNIVLSGVTFQVTASLVEEESVLQFTKYGSSTMTISEAETLLDALRYNNTATVPSEGIRTFDVQVKDGAYESAAGQFSVDVRSNPVVSQQPQDVSSAPGGNAIITITSNGTSFKWQVNPNTGVFSDITNSSTYYGATSNQLVISGITSSMNNYLYRSIVSNGGCASTSQTSRLLVVAPLAVTGLEFSAQKRTQEVSLQWSTISEQNTKEFILQHSADGISFNNLAIIAAAGTSNSEHKYGYAHQQPITGKNYYRLQQIDQDGSSRLSKVLVISFDATTSEITAWPNPSRNGQLMVQLNKTSRVLLYSTNGQLLWQRQLPVGTHQVDLSHYSKGIYLLQVENQIKRIISE
jgi:hypothetical protein